VRAALDEIEFPPTDPAVRARLAEREAQVGAEALHRELADSDPEAAAGVGSGATRRIVRARGVGARTGRPFTGVLPRPRLHDPSTVQLGRRLDRAGLHERIAARVHRMVEQGLLADVRALRAQGLDAGRAARRAIGYEKALAVLDGAMSCQQAIEETIAGTRRLVRKQDTWFRRDQRVHWLEADAGEVLVDQAVARIGAAVTARGAQQP